MHLLAAVPGRIDDGGEAVDLGQSPGDIVFLTAADTEIACLAHAQAGRTNPSLRLANLMRLGHNMSVDLYVDDVIRRAKLVVVRLLGGRAYWPYGIDEITAACAAAGAPVAFLPGDDQPDAELQRLSTVAPDAWHRLWQFLVHGGADNAASFLDFAASLIGETRDWREPVPLLRAGLYWPRLAQPTLADVQRMWRADAPVAAVVFYRALVQAANLAAIDALISGLNSAGLNALPIYAASLRDAASADVVAQLLADTNADIILNTTGFAVGRPDGDAADTPFGVRDVPVLQVILAGGRADDWRDQPNGLSARDIAMQVALPEVDGRIVTRAVAFKGLARRDAATESDIIAHEAVADRVDFVATLAARWCALRRKPLAKRKVALILANYPNRDGRIGNGVGLDTPASAVTALRSLAAAGYRVRDAPETGDDLVHHLAAGPTNAAVRGRRVRAFLDADVYATFFAGLPAAVRTAVSKRWGAPEQDPFYLRDSDGFAVPAYCCGNVAICLQPARGYNIDPVASYHDPALVPPHGYIAFYAWLRNSFGSDAVIHFGKHGNLEWLPGKSVALSEACFPDAILGPLPHLYPFIVNDPGEGTQAKRRSQAVIVDHLTPPLTRAESYGPLQELERLIDEYYEASNFDARRLPVLRQLIVETAQDARLDLDLGLELSNLDDSLSKLDSYLCELKELQIRDGLHVFGEAPAGRRLTDLLVALARVPRSTERAGLTRALATDLELGFDPLDCEMGHAWDRPKPAALRSQSDSVWRSVGDTVERLESLAAELVRGERPVPADWRITQDVLTEVHEVLQPAVAKCGDRELAGLTTGLDGRFVPPGPSGAPTRGRPEVLPTGRNFYSVDTRMVPTKAAWALGWQSATLLVERYAQEHGDWPRRMALSAWGTSNMRTGGDDIAQALALMGVQPGWDEASGRVSGIEVMPVAVLGRPRVDVTLRISGFFRDAFPGLIDLFDSAVRAVAAQDDESDGDNPLRAAVQADSAALTTGGVAADDAKRQAQWRVFGSKPGAYGAGLQALIDERGWNSTADLARAYIAWGGYAYAAGGQGQAAHQAFARRLEGVEAVVHNQDNREHDLLDSDDYYQFEGGLTAAVAEEAERAPAVYHNDHSRPFAPKVRRLEEEMARVIRARAVNPKWIAGVMRHGYKGAFEIAATVDYVFAFAATTQSVRSDQFDLLYDAYLGDDEVCGFMADHNPAALREMAARFQEARQREMWQPRSNSAAARLSEWAAGREDVS